MQKPLDLSQIRVLFWDIGGTVFDWHHSIKDEVALIANERDVEINPGEFANTWRSRMFDELARVRSGDLSWRNADEIHRVLLDELALSFPALELSPSDRDDLNQVWHRLSAWPDAPESLERLRSRYTIVILTVLSTAIAVDCSKFNGISWDAILSCEFLGQYKPNPGAYDAGLRLIGVDAPSAMMCATHPHDLQAAMRVGMRSAYVSRPRENGEGGAAQSEIIYASRSRNFDSLLKARGGSIPDFDINAGDFTDLANQLLV